MFVQVGLSAAFLTSAVKKALRQRCVGVDLALVVSALLATVPVLLSYAHVVRYLGDFYPFLIVGSVFGLASLMASNAIEPAIKRMTLDIGIFLSICSSFIWFVIQVGRW
ncbi:MAG: hypothetical protein B7C54_12790 [Acidimicrobiales bacterium mtb01]|nr:hypothetical protein [Actinomycetota bacterium]TEX45899.1 MAG: hypothetical protein B7C54_12790 [Acidimicrobiales bacterium mtb01]